MFDRLRLRHLHSKILFWRMRLGGAVIGKGVQAFGSFVRIGPLSHLSIGDHSTINHGVFLNLRDTIRIGRHVHLSPYAQLHTGGLSLEILPRTHGSAPIEISDHVWVGSAAVLLPGVHVASGAVIAAGAVVTRDVPLNTLVGGVPAKPIRVLDIKTGPR